MTITHIRDTDLKLKSKRFSFEPKPPEVDTADIRRQIRLSKDAGHSKMPTFHTILDRLCNSHDLLGKYALDIELTIGYGGIPSRSPCLEAR